VLHSQTSSNDSSSNLSDTKVKVFNVWTGKRMIVDKESTKVPLENLSLEPIQKQLIKGLYKFKNTSKEVEPLQATE
jgi:hypothetical protein